MRDASKVQAGHLQQCCFVQMRGRILLRHLLCSQSTEIESYNERGHCAFEGQDFDMVQSNHCFGCANNLLFTTNSFRQRNQTVAPALPFARTFMAQPEESRVTPCSGYLAR
uniref:Uncharacterized protein n=1 Tax=Noctiluca scintillans TaxID=2966 RepID=A0A7S0ZTA5_NOCSC|mmetsp:Transcript_17419/g.47235  ORF Transcript_17419/g.47235 Transcript_17419/m.47235 type:complete len:111 (+) Transcript_17419:345-677(+)